MNFFSRKKKSTSPHLSKFKCCICWECLWMEHDENEENRKNSKNKNRMVQCKVCKQDFHHKCLTEWKDHGGRTCPLCRTPFSSSPTHHLSFEILYGIVCELFYDFPPPPSFFTIVSHSLFWIVLWNFYWCHYSNEFRNENYYNNTLIEN